MDFASKPSSASGCWSPRRCPGGTGTTLTRAGALLIAAALIILAAGLITHG
jgi:hypothetical protein